MGDVGGSSTLSWHQEYDDEVTRIIFDGYLTSERDFDGLSVPTGVVVFDFGEVRGIDRGGIRGLLSLLRRLRIDQSVTVDRCPTEVAAAMRGNPALAMRLPITATLEGGAVPEPQKQQQPARRAERHRVHMQLRYRTAREFVQEYADNLSHGGLFIKGAKGVEAGSDVEVELELPGRGVFKVRGLVRNIVSQEDVADGDCTAGAGVELVDVPQEFQDALSSYLTQLGRRRDSVVLASNDPVLNYVEQFGYQGVRIEYPLDLMTVVAHAEHPVVGIIVSRRQEAAFISAAAEHGLDELIASVDYLEEIDRLLPEFDDRLPL